MFEAPFWGRIDAIDGERVLLRARYASYEAYEAQEAHIDVVDANERPVTILEPRFKYKLESGDIVVTNELHAV
ncbi:Phosphohydrolase [Pseudomonas chlororaphis]|uniref:hypothetical protein n=1 Tax=Pseudomonas chlororaphis TaxID=587753 RepID=UPI0039E47A76